MNLKCLNFDFFNAFVLINNLVPNYQKKLSFAEWRSVFIISNDILKTFLKNILKMRTNLLMITMFLHLSSNWRPFCRHTRTRCSRWSDISWTNSAVHTWTFSWRDTHRCPFSLCSPNSSPLSQWSSGIAPGSWTEGESQSGWRKCPEIDSKFVFSAIYKSINLKSKVTGPLSLIFFTFIWHMAWCFINFKNPFYINEADLLESLRISKVHWARNIGKNMGCWPEIPSSKYRAK